jgi:YD repeat-containing protein
MDRRVVMTNPEGGRFSSTYDVKGRLIRHVNPQSKRTTIAWDVLDRKREERIANGSITTYIYNAASELTGIVQATGLGLVQRLSDH